ncbi:ANTAR domain-containing protein [Microbacterium sp. STN6]|uniref:ANTAR domain-containing protein n=1 Tax=Microbacterium sp. STN6 TaxID=2995588 RepID=UPI002260B51B|nr:ANTAR domain-containing protein [Microbacterium sp. STN6]MCX7523156.1 ANTAR domain-containing protein [Microbacterium sp. STN6]
MERPDAAYFADVAARLDAASDAADLLRIIAETAAATAGESCEASVLLRRRGTLQSAAATTYRASRVDLLAVECGEGAPVLSSLAGDAEPAAVSSGDLASDARWQTWGVAASAAGFRSVLSVSLHARGAMRGVTSVYSGRRDAFAASAREALTVLSKHAAIALAAAALHDDLNQAIDAHTVVGQAQGVLMATYALTPERAFEVLRRYSQDRNVKLRALAERVVETRRLPER